MKKLLALVFLLFLISVFSYNVRIGDTISIEILNHPDLSRTVKVAFDGTIPYPYAGNIKVAGKTVDEIAELLKPYAEKIVKDPIITVYVVDYAPMLVFLQGAINKTFDISIYPNMTLTKLLSFLGISKSFEVDFENIQIKRGNQVISVDLIPYFYEGKFDNDVLLKEGDIIYLPPFSKDKTIQVMGAYTLEIPYEPNLSLSSILLKLGPIDEKVAEIENAKIYMGNTLKTVNLEDIISGKTDITLVLGTKIYIPKRKEKYAYIIGFVTNPGLKSFNVDEEISLKLLLAKAGGIPDDQKEYVEKIIVTTPDGKQYQYEKDILEKDTVFPIGTIVNIQKYPEFYVYVQGYANKKGKIELLPDEEKTLKILLAKVGIPNEDIENEGVAVINNEIKINIKDVIFGDSDYILKNGDIVQITYEPFVVNVVGQNGGNFILSYKEPRTLSYLIKKLGINQPETIEEVILIRNGKIENFSIDTLIYENINIPLERYDTIVIKNAQTNAVYITGDVSAYITFEYNEEITLQKILAKVGLSDYRKIESITLNGKKLNFKEDIPIEKGAILNVNLKKPIYVTAMGYLKQTGRVSFNYDETADLRNLFGKLGGLIIGPDMYYTSEKVYIIRNGVIVKELDAQKVYSGEENAELQNNDFVFVTEKEPNYVYVFGKNMPNTIVQFKNSETFDFKTLLAKIGGIKEGISRTVTILDDSTITTFTWDEYSNITLKKGSTILFNIDTKNYVFVVDANGKPNMIYLDKENTTLYEIISKISTSKAYKFAKIIKNGVEKTVDISNIEYTLSYNIHPGDIIKIIDAPQNIAYVLGEVNKPGIISVNEGTTVLEAIISAGYFSAKAAPSSVYLYKGGVNGEAIKVNLSGAIKGGNIVENPKVEPGDIVYVPADAFKTALDWIPVINSMIDFYNNISGLYNNIAGN
ncbi:MAG: SLBB domain-containing protein [Thermosipho sp. (in: Bacteria)]|nr:SLBB domain-containing protein [Thermosipho sp. (in: thermotogales)]